MPETYTDIHRMVDEQAAELSSDIQLALKDPHLKDARLDALLALKQAIAHFIHAQRA